MLADAVDDTSCRDAELVEPETDTKEEVPEEVPTVLDCI